MRSKLFVPASRPELYAKALAGEADALSFDLEDSVTADRKDEARQQLAQWLASPEAQATDKTLIVRVNAMDTPYFAQDVQAVAVAGVAMLNLPKAEHIEQIREAAQVLAQAERANGVRQPIGLLLNVESPRALRCAAELAAAEPRVVGLQLGLGDLFEPLGIARREVAAVTQALFMLRLAAGEAGVFAYDSAFADIRDAEGFQAEAELARRMGFLGKSCIHPSQVALANGAFRPSEAEIAHAVRVIEAARDADARGVGAYVVDGKMIDAPFVRRAEAIIDMAQRLGLL